MSTPFGNRPHRLHIRAARFAACFTASFVAPEQSIPQAMCRTRPDDALQNAARHG
jgi:hypothetical protein